MGSKSSKANSTNKPKTETNDIEYLRVFLFGHTYVGKTCLGRTYEKGSFEENTNLRIGIDRYLKTLVVCNKRVYLDIFNPQAMTFQRSDETIPSYARHAHGILLLFDVNVVRTFKEIQKYLEIIKKSNPGVPTFLVRARCDLERDPMVLGETPQEFARKENLQFFECSAKTGENVEKIFEQMALRILQRKGFTIPDKTEIEGKSLEWKETKDIHNISVTEEERLYASVAENKILQTSVTENEMFKSEQQAATVEVSSGKFNSELKTNSSQLENVHDMLEPFQKASANRQALKFEQESGTFKTSIPSSEDGITRSRQGNCNLSMKKDDDMSFQSNKEKSLDLNESCHTLGDTKCVVTEAKKSVLSEEERQLEGKCPSWFS